MTDGIDDDGKVALIDVTRIDMTRLDCGLSGDMGISVFSAAHLLLPLRSSRQSAYLHPDTYCKGYEENIP